MATQHQSWPFGNGEMHSLTRGHDWAATSLGTHVDWPQYLKCAVEICLGSSFPSFLWWGPELIEIHNDAASRLFLEQPLGGLGLPARTVWADEWPILGPLVNRALQTGEAVTVEDMLLSRKQGPSQTGAYYTLCLSALRNEHGTIEGMLVVAIETTRKVRAESAISESEEQYRTLFESIDQGFCTIEVLFDDNDCPVDYVFLEVNPAFERNTGLHDAVGKRMRSLAPSHEQFWFDIYGEIVRTGEPARFEHEAAALDRWYDVYGFRIGQPGNYRVAVLFADITERRNAEIALRESEARFRAVAHLVPDLLWSHDPTGAATWINQRWIDYTGEDIGALQGQDWFDVIHPDDQPLSRSRFQIAVEQGTPFVQEHRLRRYDGDYRWFLVRAEPIRDETGQIVQWFGSATDVHEEQVAREELEARVKAATTEMRSLSRRLLLVQEEERRNLARELHDEIGQVLTGLGFELSTSRTGNKSRLAEAQRIVAELTEQVRQLSMDLRPAALDTYGLLPALLWHVERYQKRTGITVDLRQEGVDRRFTAPVEIAAYRIVQEALTNVARHAGVDHVQVQLFADATMLTVAIRENGLGFNPESPAPGGLSGMRERAALTGGTLTIDTAPGQGVVVTAELPINDPDNGEVSS